MRRRCGVAVAHCCVRAAVHLVSGEHFRGADSMHDVLELSFRVTAPAFVRGDEDVADRQDGWLPNGDQVVAAHVVVLL